MTAQIMDSLLFAGGRYMLASEPLAPWLNRRRNRGLRFQPDSTANRRGYTSTWAVDDGRLYLTSFEATSPDGTPTTLHALFPGEDARVLADWFTGGVRCPMGKMISYEHSGYGSVHEYDLILWFIEGALVEQRLNRNRPCMQTRSRQPLPDGEVESELDEADGADATKRGRAGKARPC